MDRKYYVVLFFLCLSVCSFSQTKALTVKVEYDSTVKELTFSVTNQSSGDITLYGNNSLNKGSRFYIREYDANKKEVSMFGYHYEQGKDAFFYKKYIIIKPNETVKFVNNLSSSIGKHYESQSFKTFGIDGVFVYFLWESSDKNPKYFFIREEFEY